MVAASGDVGAAYGLMAKPQAQKARIVGNYSYKTYDTTAWGCQASCSTNNFGGYWPCAAWMLSDMGTSVECTIFSLGMPFEVVPGNSTVGGPNVVDGEMYAMYPASSRYVVSVGATTVYQNGAVLGTWMPEMAVNSYGSGGGFWKRTDTPEWQKSAVHHYAKHGPYKVRPSPADATMQGRGYPDVAVLGQNLAVAMGNPPTCCFPATGTSATAPIFAAIVSHLNVARKQAGKPQMGFINPWLYQHGHMFNDVLEGANNILQNGPTMGYGPATKYGYSAARGWDPVTGFLDPSC